MMMRGNMKVSIVVATWIWWNAVVGPAWVCSLMVAEQHTLNDQTVTFTTAGATVESYTQFIEALRAQLASGEKRHGIPVMREPSTVPDYERYVLVELSNGDYQVTLAVNVTNAFVEAYQTGSRSFLLKETIHNPFPGTEQLYNLSFSGNYIELQNWGGNRRDIDLGMRPLETAITNLQYSKQKDIPRSLIVVIQMVAEAVRFRYIEHQVNQSITRTNEFRPDYLMLSLENKWGALSKAIQQSNQEGDFSGSVKLTTVDNGPLIVSNVSSAINNSGLAIMLFDTSRGGAGISSLGGPKLKYIFISSIIVTIIFF